MPVIKLQCSCVGFKLTQFVLQTEVTTIQSHPYMVIPSISRGSLVLKITYVLRQTGAVVIVFVAIAICMIHC